MAINKFRYQHIRTNTSNVPSSELLKEGEIAVGLLKDEEKLFIKNTHGEVVDFIPEKKIDEKLSNVSGDVADLKADKFGAVAYSSNEKKIYFYDNSTTQHKIGEIDATDFIKDGMVDNVEIIDIEESGETVTYLVITFNTDAGKEPIYIPLKGIFHPENYYTKGETDTLLSGKQNTLTAGEGIDITDNVITVTAESVVDQAIIEGSTHAVAGGAVYAAFQDVNLTLSNKQDTLVSGTNLKNLTKKEYNLLGSGTQNLYIVDLSDVTVDTNNDVIFDAGSF